MMPGVRALAGTLRRQWLMLLASGVLALIAAPAAATSVPPADLVPESSALSSRIDPTVPEPNFAPGAPLGSAPLVAARLYGADLRGADLRGAQLQAADLRRADLRGARLDGANLQGARLWGANLQGASLRGAKLARVDLRRADLRLADLRGVDFYGEPDWDALAEAIQTRVPALSDARRRLRAIDVVRERPPSVEGANLAHTLLDRPVCVFPPVSPVDILHGYDKSEADILVASAEGFAPDVFIRERTGFLGRLACNDGQGRVAHAFAAGLLDERHLPAKETALDPAMLINALLASQCLGGQALSETTRQALTRKLSELAN
jgi:uncharacterized protein YjbI with pentapeptide repeats